MRDFKLKLSRRSRPGGAGRASRYTTAARRPTRSTSTAPTSPPDPLPLKADGLTVDEDSKSLHRIDSIEQLNLGDSGDLNSGLRPGHYVLYCNLEGHYLGGMHASFDVRPDGK